MPMFQEGRNMEKDKSLKHFGAALQAEKIKSKQRVGDVHKIQLSKRSEEAKRRKDNKLENLKRKYFKERFYCDVSKFDLNEERQYRKTATKGVLQLLNALTKARGTVTTSVKKQRLLTKPKPSNSARKRWKDKRATQRLTI